MHLPEAAEKTAQMDCFAEVQTCTFHTVETELTLSGCGQVRGLVVVEEASARYLHMVDCCPI